MDKVIVEVIKRSKFVEESLQIINVNDKQGIQAEIGKQKGDDKTSTHAFLFDPAKGWNIDSATKWVTDYGFNLASYDTTKSLDILALDCIVKDQLDISRTKMFVDSSEFTVGTKSADDSDTFDGIIISGYLSTFKNTDRHGDVIMDGAFSKTIKGLKRLPMLKDHNADTNSQIGVWTKFKQDENGLHVTGRISKTAQTEHIIKLIQDGAIDTLSMGGLFKYAEEKDKKGNNIIEEVVLLEGSVVTIPANPKAQFELVKSLITEKAQQVEAPKAERVSQRDKAIRAIKLYRQE